MTEEEVKKIIGAAVADAFKTSAFKDAVVTAMTEALQAEVINKAVKSTLKSADEAGPMFL